MRDVCAKSIKYERNTGIEGVGEEVTEKMRTEWVECLYECLVQL